MQKLPRSVALRGVTTRALLLEEGALDADIRRWVRSGALHRVCHGRFVHGATRRAASPESRLTLDSVAVQLGTDRALAHESALAACGLPLLSPGTAVHLARPTGSRRSSPKVAHHVMPTARVIRLAEVRPELHVWADVPVVEPARAIAHLGRTRLWSAVTAADAALHRGMLTVGELEASSWRVARLADGHCESAGESVLRLTMRMVGMTPESQVPLLVNGKCYRPDFLFEHCDVIVEFDGDGKYDGPGNRGAHAREKLRDDELRAAGYIVVHVVWAEFAKPDVLLAKIRAALESGRRARAARGGAPATGRRR